MATPAYGAGEAFVRSVSYVSDLPQPVQEIHYFRDLAAERRFQGSHIYGCAQGLPGGQG